MSASLHEAFVDAEVVGQLRVKGGQEEVAAFDEYGEAAMDPESSCGRVQLDDARRPDEYAVKGSLQRLERELGREAVDLATVGVSKKLNRGSLETRWLPLTPAKEDRSGAGSKAGETTQGKQAQGLEKAILSGEKGHHRALATGQDEPGERFEISGLSNLTRLYSKAFQRSKVQVVRALDRKNPNRAGGFVHALSSGGAVTSRVLVSGSREESCSTLSLAWGIRNPP